MGRRGRHCVAEWHPRIWQYAPSTLNPSPPPFTEAPRAQQKVRQFGQVCVTDYFVYLLYLPPATPCVPLVVYTHYALTTSVTAAEQWSMIQLVHFPSRPGTAFQNKIKDKWRVLCKGVKNRNSARSNLPAHLWDRVETLSKLYSIL